MVRGQLSGIGSLLSLRGYQEPNSSPQARLQALLLPALDLPSLCTAFPTRILLQDFHHPEPCLLTYKPWSPDTDPSRSLNPQSEATQVLHGSNQCDQCLPQDLHTHTHERESHIQGHRHILSFLLLETQLKFLHVWADKKAQQLKGLFSQT